ncbi:MAG: DNA recombination protein RecN, partial [Methanobacteriota archaeon]
MTSHGPDLPWRGPRRAVRGRGRRHRPQAHPDDRARPRGPVRAGRQRLRGHRDGHRELPRGADREGRPEGAREQGR